MHEPSPSRTLESADSPPSSWIRVAIYGQLLGGVHKDNFCFAVPLLHSSILHLDTVVHAAGFLSIELPKETAWFMPIELPMKLPIELDDPLFSFLVHRYNLILGASHFSLIHCVRHPTSCFYYCTYQSSSPEGSSTESSMGENYAILYALP